MSTPLAVRCICPPDGQRHPEGDTISLRDKLDFRAVTTLRWAVTVLRENDPDASVEQTLAVLTENYVLSGVESWTLRDDKNKPIEVTHAAIREFLLTQFDVAQQVADVADDLYLAVMLPLLSRASTSSPPSPTTGSTSPETGSSPKRPRRSKRSSISTIRTAGTETTSSSLDGVSSSSLNSESAA